MRSMKRWLLILLSALCAVSALAVAAACGGKKGKEEVTLTFYVNGGSPVDAVTAKPGETVQLPVTEKEHFTFEGWHLDAALADAVLPASIPAPKEDTSYYAGWTENAKADYTVNVYVQNPAATAYRRDPQKTVYGTAYVGESLTPDLTFENFIYQSEPKLGTDTPAPVSTLTISKDAEENVFHLYFDRVVYPVRYEADLPAGSFSGSVPEQQVRYEGTTATNANGFTADGYRFVGWSRERNGANAAEILPAGDTEHLLTVLGPTTLYAVWDKAYSDRAGSDDRVYFPRLEEGVAYMERGGHEFKGEREGDNFTFKNDAGDTMLAGKVFDTRFSYAHADFAKTYILYDNYTDPKYASATDDARYKPGVTLQLDEYLNATYTDEKGTSHTGALAFDGERGDYLLTFSDGTESIYVLFRDLGAGDRQYIFSIAGKEAGYYLEVLSPTYYNYVTGEALILDGYGGAVLYANTAGSNFIGFDGNYYIDGFYYNEASKSYVYKLFVSISDPLGMFGEEGGMYANYLMTIPLNTSATGEDFDGYVKSNGLYLGFGANGEELAYHAEGGETLVLDGLGYFDDSAVYTDAEQTVHTGRYEYVNDVYSGLVVIVTDKESGDTFSLKITGGAFEVLEKFDPESYIEYRRMTDALDYPVLVLFEDETVNVDGTPRPRAEIYLDDGNGGKLYGGEGWCEMDTSLNLVRYTFHLLTAAQGRENDVPHTLVFYLTQANSQEDNEPVDVYIVLEEDGEKCYEIYELEDGSELLVNNDRSIVLGLGSIWLRRDGSVVEGSIAEGASEHFGYTYIEFTYGDESGAARRVRYIEGENGWKAVGEELALQIYLYDEETNTSQFVQNLVLDNFLLDGGSLLAQSGNAVYDYGTADTSDWQPVRYEVVGATVFGRDNIYSLTMEGRELFRFAVVLFTDSNGNTDYVYFIEDPDFARTFTSDDGSTLQLDGFYRAEYLDAAGNRIEGTYSVDPEGKELYFTADSGEADFYILIDLEKGTFYPLDNAYGEWILVDYTGVRIGGGDGSYYTLNFDGRGNVSVTHVGGTDSTRTGVYEAVNVENGEYRVFVNLPGHGTSENGWNIQLYNNLYEGEKDAILFDETTAGTFINENWDVLWLDGFGGGILRSADGSISGTGAYSVINEDFGFTMFMLNDTDQTTVFLLLDGAKKTFRLIDYSDMGGVWFAENLNYLAFSVDGTFQIGARGTNAENTSGAYFFDDEKIYLVFYNLNVIEIDLPTPETKFVEVKGEKFYRWNSANGKLTLNGTIEFYGKDGTKLTDQETLTATLSADIRIGANYNNATVFTIQEKEYSGFTLNIYTNGKVDPRVTYGGATYSVTFHYDGTDASTFTVKAGYTEERMNDYYNGLQEGGEDGNGNYTGGRIIKSSLGFGPIKLGEASYSGTFYYANKIPSQKADPLTFAEVKESSARKLGYRADLNSDLLEILFTVGGKNYAIDFVESYAEEVGACYILWGFYTYEEKTAECNGETYNVLIKYLVRATAPGTTGYGHDGYNALPKDLEGVAVNATLTRANGEVVSPADLGATLTHDGVWLAVRKADGSGYDGYLLTFEMEGNTITKVNLNIYNFRSAEAVGGYLVYFLTDAEGKAVELLAVYSGSQAEGYTVVDVTDVEKVTSEEGAWIFKGAVTGGMETSYKVKIEKDAEGKYAVTVTEVRE